MFKFYPAVGGSKNCDLVPSLTTFDSLIVMYGGVYGSAQWSRVECMVVQCSTVEGGGLVEFSRLTAVTNAVCAHITHDPTILHQLIIFFI